MAGQLYVQAWNLNSIEWEPAVFVESVDLSALIVLKIVKFVVAGGEGRSTLR